MKLENADISNKLLDEVNAKKYVVKSNNESENQIKTMKLEISAVQKQLQIVS